MAVSSSHRKQQTWKSTELVEGPAENSRFFDYDLLHLFELNPIVPATTKPPPLHQTVPRGGFSFGPIYEGGMSGDMFITGQFPTTSQPSSSRWPFYMSGKNKIEM